MLKKNIFILFALLLSSIPMLAQQKSWTADNGNGTYTNPLFYDEFSDPDLIRVGDTFYLVGTTMHCNPGLMVLESKDLVNWDFCSYAFDRLEIDDPHFRLEDGREAYGQGIWAPCIRYFNSKFHIFSNINGIGMQVYVSDNPKGPWKHYNMGGWIHDLSVLYDNGKIWAIYGYDEVHAIEIKPDFSGYVDGSDHVIIPCGNAMGEGHHAYIIDGKYYIISADYNPMGRMMCARADRLDGPYETRCISCRETLGIGTATWISNLGMDNKMPEKGKYRIQTWDPKANAMGCATLHQGGIVQTREGEWWGFSMQDFRAVGRTTSLSPITWEDGWPYFGLPGNLGRTPRTWIKPKTTIQPEPHAPYQRSDNFDGKVLQPIWQWNHIPVDGKWSLGKGKLCLNTLPAKDLYYARNTLTQRGMGPVSEATVQLDGSRLKDGDIAGFGLFNIPYEMLALKKENGALLLLYYDLGTDETRNLESKVSKVWLRIKGDFENERATFSYSLDGVNFKEVVKDLLVPYQTKTFQGARYALFAFNESGQEGGCAQFDNFTVTEPLADRSKNIPLDKDIHILNIGNLQRMCALPRGILHTAWAGADNYDGDDCIFTVHDRGQGRVVLEAMNDVGFLCVMGKGLSGDVRFVKEENEDCLLQWQDLLHGEFMLLSLKTNRYIGLNPETGETYAADWDGTLPGRKSGAVFKWDITEL